jgi:adenosylcobinamide-phosphate synthase
MLIDPAYAAVTAAILVGALALDWLIGDPAWIWRRLPHPVVLAGRLIGWQDRRLNRVVHADGTRRLLGVVAIMSLLTLAVAVGLALAAITRALPGGWAVELLVVAILLAQRDLFDHVRAVGRGLTTGGLEGGRKAVARIVGRDPASLDAHGVARAAIESLAENFSDGVVAPAFWYLLCGPAGLCAYKALNTADSMIGHRTPRHRMFGWAAARLDDLANLAPARLAALLLILAAVVAPGAQPFAALRVTLADARKHKSPNAGWPEAAMAGALGLSLAGPRRYGDELVADPWLNAKGRAMANVRDIRRALALFAVACVMLLAATGALLAVLTPR